MRFVTPKTESQQCLSALHRVRESLVRERVKASNQIHGFLLEFGIGLPVGHAVIRRLPSVLAERALGRQLEDDDLGQRLMSLPGVGPITASVLAAEVGDGKQYRCGRDFTASIGLVPRQYSTGGKTSCWALANAATRTYDACSCNAPERICSAWGTIAIASRNGCAPC
jgi:transposase